MDRIENFEEIDMGFISRLFGGEEKLNEAVMQAAQLKSGGAKGGIAYDAVLVDRLKEDHQELVRIFTAIKTAAGEGRFNQLPELLSGFKLAFQTHVMLENVKFYVYLQQHCAQDTETSSFVSEVRKEMDGIARAVVKFVNTHTATVHTHDTVAGFNAELDNIGAVLLRRVQLEESRLYSLYLPNY